MLKLDLIRQMKGALDQCSSQEQRWLVAHLERMMSPDGEEWAHALFDEQLVALEQMRDVGTRIVTLLEDKRAAVLKYVLDGPNPFDPLGLAFCPVIPRAVMNEKTQMWTITEDRLRGEFALRPDLTFRDTASGLPQDQYQPYFIFNVRFLEVEGGADMREPTQDMGTSPLTTPETIAVLRHSQMGKKRELPESFVVPIRGTGIATLDTHLLRIQRSQTMEKPCVLDAISKTDPVAEEGQRCFYFSRSPICI